ncbi:polysaccharide pyruvyl transferase family protein [Isoalcanivorax indicus]|uniref:polysaccharide pyruvyl transferase family protein n=1 Tax=Isoalcanivorax indicus TaxID=2202653 RepID=UPI000DBA5C20|nr:polysaccharide pyruvyl transferase family protein [Isoalcanivorax indicus]
MEKVVFCGASSIYGIDNFGDQLLRDLYMSWVKEVCPKAEMEFLMHKGLYSRKGDWVKSISSADLLVFNGGGYFGEKPFLNDGWIKKIIKKMAWGLRNDDVYGSAFRIAEAQSVPVVISGVEVGPISNPIFRRVVARAINYSSYCCVRNGESHSNAISMAIKGKKVNLAVDSAMSIDRDRINDLYPESLPSRVDRADRFFMLGLHVHELTDCADVNYFKGLVSKVRDEIPNGYELKIVVIHDQKKAGQHPARSADAERLLVNAIDIDHVLSYQEPGQLLKEVSELDLVITTKLHLGIVARSLSVPVISCPSHVIKTKRFYDYIEELDFCDYNKEGFKDGLPEKLMMYLRSGQYDGMCVKEAVKKSAKTSELNFKDAVSSLLADGRP